jgi:RNA polymerase sigma factor (sigma-70 family)
LPLDRQTPALEQLAAACCELVRRGRKGRREDAEDVAQDACVHLLQLPAPQKVREPARYLARIRRNLLIDGSRRRKREAALFDSAANTELAGRDGLDPERISSGKEALLRALAAIDELPPRCRQAFELHRFDGLNYVGIAHRMGISASMVEKHIAEAMLRLARAFASGQDEAGLPTGRVRRTGMD